MGRYGRFDTQVVSGPRDYSDTSINTYWDDQRRRTRDAEREPQSTRPRIPLSERGAVRARFVPVCEQAEHDAIKADDARWSSLEYVGMQPTYDDTPGAAQHDAELRVRLDDQPAGEAVTPAQWKREMLAELHAERMNGRRWRRRFWCAIAFLAPAVGVIGGLVLDRVGVGL